MAGQGYCGHQRNGPALMVIVAAHAAALGAIALAKMDLPDRPIFKRLETRNIPIPKIEPDPIKKVEERRIEPKVSQRVTVIDPIVVVDRDTPIEARPTEERVVFDPLPPGPTTEPVAQPELPHPEPPVLAKATKLKPRGNPADWVTNDDYPAAALRAEEQGRTAFRLAVGSDGRPTGCIVTASSGSSSLDRAACTLVMRRARFTPGKDESGNAVGGSYANSFSWRIPDE